MDKKPKRKREKGEEGKKRNSLRDVLKWQGLLAEEPRHVRYTALGFLAIVSAALTFMQLGFLGVGAEGSYLCYVSTLLFPIVLTSLMLGRYWGVLMGFFSGGVLLIHANVQPLDIFEQYFIGPLNSIGIYTFTGLVVSVCLALALHNNARGLRAAVYLLVTCLAISCVYSICYIVNLLVATAERLMEMYPTAMDQDSVSIPYDSLKALASTGDPALQLILNFAIMFGMCLLAGVLVQEYKKINVHPRLSQVFRIRLFMVLLCAFLVTSAVSFVVTTEQSKRSAHEHMDAETATLVNRIETRDDKSEALDGLQEDYEIEESDLLGLRDSFSPQRILDGYSLEDDGTVLIASDGKVALSNNPAFEVGETLEKLYGPDWETMFNSMAHEGKMLSMLYGKADPQSEEDDDLIYMSTTEIGYACARQTNGSYAMMMLPSREVFVARSATMLWMSLSALVLLLVMYLIASRLLTLIVVNEIDQTNESLAKITDGDLSERVEVAATDEFASLSEGINTTVEALKGWIGEAERRMEHELSTAKAIQESALPRTFPPFPQIDAFDIYASMNAAKEVGGDFYDVFEIDDHTVGFLIADVSGKGVPASLFMMAAKTEIENYMSTGMEISQAILSANQRLCRGNDAGMFVTVWAATLDWRTGELTYCNAGHNFPLLRHGAGGPWEWLNKKCGLFLGTFETAKYRQQTLTLQPGDELVLYTDGVNEAFSVDEEEYGNDRLEAFLTDHADLHPRQMVEALRADVARWAEGAEQSDDITMLCLEYGVAPEVMDTMEVPATLDHLREVADPVLRELDEHLCPADIKHKVDVAIEELFVNVCRYAYADQDEPGMVRVSYTYTANPSTMAVEFVDQGVPFNPVTREDPTAPSNIQEAKIGGLGIFMVKKTMDDLSYRYLNGNNVVTFTISW